ncbi:MarR family winged helix-turn-helix transcriptional regulator [Heyndrickxia ginsengihumi]|uniref:MarR family transcriptional regulator n=1 Tax=Heyndrickxia ginsengihumi TaxID=363870 RepID=A0A0A6VD28_9BACI|nr:MarR family winged helix-turn-helix transcriptional regulator [Heyndrickxia ginsengihumi]KHD85486.1 MarR family transcriptional regulator [Heyndrickxia ginsengihumi]MBE6183168.1 winged helix-turn-helix transcriptional regulator [Bacillus sp. (in: firmicutes)]MCM3023840.1 MarR family winged helix-turn-helix transcriptional regulator [Heyndrickxia ginsengihumi]
MSKNVSELNALWTDIYYLLRYKHSEKVTHIGVRIMQVIQKEKEVTIKDIAKEIAVSHNTASEHIKRLTEKQYLYKTRSSIDERKVIIKLTDIGKDVLHRNSNLDEAKLKTIFETATDVEKQSIISAFRLLKELAKRCT